MNTIKLKVEAAMRKSWSAYYGYNHWLRQPRLKYCDILIPSRSFTGYVQACLRLTNY